MVEHGSPRILRQAIRGVPTATNKRVAKVDSSCRLLTVLPFRGSKRSESLILSHHFRFTVTCECNREEMNDDDE